MFTLGSEGDVTENKRRRRKEKKKTITGEIKESWKNFIIVITKKEGAWCACIGSPNRVK